MKNTHWMPAMAAIIVIAARAAAQQPAPSPPPASPAAAADCARAQPQIMRTIDAANMRLEAARQNNSPPAMRAAVDDLQGALGQIRAQLAACRDLEQAAAADPHAGHTMPGMPQTPAPPGAMPMMKPGSTTSAPAAPGAAAPAAADPHAGHATPSVPPARTSAEKPPSGKPPAAPAADPHAGHAKPSAPPARTPAAKPPSGKPPAPAAAEPHAGHDTTAPAAGKTTTAKVMDPVTGLMVDPATAPKTTYQGQTYYFSSEQAREEFVQNPAKFARKPKS